MIEDLIQKSQTKEFYQDSDLKLESYSYNATSLTLEIILSINQISYDIPIQYEEWKITCLKTEKFYGFFNSLLLPYVKLKILNHHPLLLEYHESEFECELKGEPKDINSFIGEISNTLEKTTGNWIKFSEIFWNCEEQFKLYAKRIISIPKSLVQPILQVCERHGLSFEVINEIIGDDKGYADKPKSKILIFGNEDICENNFYLNQHYVIAEEFIGEKISTSN